MPPLSMLIKPASGNCNIRCKYCFYHSIVENRESGQHGMMEIETLELLVKKAFDYADDFISFAFQGGEPTIRGLDFYKALIEMQKKHNTKNIKISNSIQTNGIVMDTEWAQFLSKNEFLVGLSLDGPKDVNDMNRIDAKGKGTYSTVMNALNLFNKHKVEYNILFVVNNLVARHIIKVYKFFKKNNFKYIQFIPCLDPLDEKPGAYPYSLTPKRYGEFLKKLFDLWYEDIKNDNYISIRTFDNLVSMFMGYRPESCGMTGVCACQFVVEADGNVYPCDFYVLDEWKLGNLMIDNFDNIIQSPAVSEFIESSKHISPECRECQYANICRGGCRRSREPFENDKPVLNYFCPSYKEFYAYAGSRMNELARLFS